MLHATRRSLRSFLPLALSATALASVAALSQGCGAPAAGSTDGEGSDVSFNTQADAGQDASQDAGAAEAALVFSQVFAGGGMEGAPFKRDFIELFNRSTKAQTLGGLSLQFASGTGEFPATTDGGAPVARLALPASVEVPPGGYVSIALGGDSIGAEAGTGADFAFNLAVALTPTAINLSVTSGKIALVRGNEPLACGTAEKRCATERVVDMIGWGGEEVSDHEGGQPMAALSASTAARRAGNGCVDTNDNGADFAAAAPEPRNAESDPDYCGASAPEPTGDEDPTLQGLVISQVFGGGGLPGSPYKRDYVEVFNASAEPRVLTGLSLQYAAKRSLFVPVTNAQGSTSSVITFPAAKDGKDIVLAPGAYFLVVIGGRDDGDGDELEGNMVVKAGPSALDLDGRAGKIALVRGAEPLRCGTAARRCARDRIVDLVGYGDGASDYEGTGAAPDLADIKAAVRRENGCGDDADNASDFVAGTPAPRNTLTDARPCGVTPTATPIDDAEPESEDEEEADDAPRVKKPAPKAPLAESTPAATSCSIAHGPARGGLMLEVVAVGLALLPLRRRRARD
ncbi:MAG: lamin tail domain-containing protein [Labilithrix sp.]|nr:lamin tail domain-containing protein [Labilithrix sp.]MCW5812001.1 lamin tail domain-containing protein [Labilithrix sp.]